ncbi:MAG: MBL fold metallo-hydrolase [Lachnospiraceae bacterium]|nr:MBL fold metallo-hydrolase [Lachnospiraceae bacterium]
MNTVKNKFFQMLPIGALLILITLIFGCIKPYAVEGTYDAGQQENQTAEQSNCLEVHFIDVGQGDCTLLINGGHAMLIDAGDNHQGTKVQKYLREQGIEKLDYVIGTHPDADHIGGLDVILTKFDCDVVLFPDAESDTLAYRQMMEAVKYKGYSITRPELFKTYAFGDASFQIVGPAADYTESSNNESVALKVTFGENSFLFIGDAEKDAQTDMMQSGADLKSDVLKAGHHGSSDSADRLFLETVGAEYTVISCGMGNDYGHPHAKTLKLLRELGMKVFRTDEQGTVTAVSNGSEITWSCEPSVTWMAGVYGGSDTYEGGTAYGGAGEASAEDGSSESAQEAESALTHANYILNTNSYKFHRPECESVLDMSERNKQGSNLSREEIVAQGYVPCNRCKP